MRKHNLTIVLIAFSVLLGAVVANAGDDDPMSLKDIKKMVKKEYTDEEIIAEIEERGMDFELEIKHKAELSMEGAGKDLLLYLNDPEKYKKMKEPPVTMKFGGLTVDIDGSWLFTDRQEVPFELALFVDDEKKASKSNWTRLIEAAGGDGTLLGAGEFVTKMTLEPGRMDVTGIKEGEHVIKIAMVTGYSNPTSSRLLDNVIYQERITITANSNETINLEASTRSNGRFELK